LPELALLAPSLSSPSSAEPARASPGELRKTSSSWAAKSRLRTTSASLMVRVRMACAHCLVLVSVLEQLEAHLRMISMALASTAQRQDPVIRVHSMSSAGEPGDYPPFEMMALSARISASSM
jgi:hypothetical protein